MPLDLPRFACLLFWAKMCKKKIFKVKIVSPELILELFWCKIERCVLKFLPSKTLKTFSKYVHRLLIEQNYKKIIWNLQRNKKIPPLPQFHVWLQSLKVVPCCTWRSNQKITSSFVFFSLLFFSLKKEVKLYEMELKYRENGRWEKSSVLFF